MLEGWHSVTKQNPCPICGHSSWCIVTDDGAICICHRTENNKPTKSGNGWVFHLDGNEDEYTPVVRPQPAQKKYTPDIAAYFSRLPKDKDNLQLRMCRYLAKQLGLSESVLIRLDWRYDRWAKAVAIPMRAADGTVTGIRYRDIKTGKKWSKRGSKDGLFFDPTGIPEKTDELIVCEGPTDCAAAISVGAWCVGRSSCGTGRDLIREFMRLHRVKHLTIFADADEPKTRPNGTKWNPGLDGAFRLGKQLRCQYRVVLPPLRVQGHTRLAEERQSEPQFIQDRRPRHRLEAQMIDEKLISYEQCHEYARSLCGQCGIPQCDVADVGSDAYLLSLRRSWRADDKDNNATVANRLMYTATIDIIRRRNNKAVTMLSYAEDIKEPDESEDDDASIARREGAPVTLAACPHAAASATLAACPHADIDDDWQNPFWLRLFENERDKLSRDKKHRLAYAVLKAGLKDSRLRLAREELRISGSRFSGILELLKERFALCFQALHEYRRQQ